jgi:hypothetical protein
MRRPHDPARCVLLRRHDLRYACVQRVENMQGRAEGPHRALGQQESGAAGWRHQLSVAGDQLIKRESHEPRSLSSHCAWQHAQNLAQAMHRVRRGLVLGAVWCRRDFQEARGVLLNGHRRCAGRQERQHALDAVRGAFSRPHQCRLKQRGHYLRSRL